MYQNQTLVYCPIEESTTTILLPVEGASLVKMGCGCYFYLDGMKIEAEIPCKTDFVVESEDVLPVHIARKELNGLKF